MVLPYKSSSGIITGYIDSFCLLCEEHLKSNEVSSHIVSTTHKKFLDSTAYIQKYHEDHIRKVKAGYYCEFCNVLMQTLAKIGIHVKEASHMNNKNWFLLRPTENGVVVFDEVHVDLQAWHGLNENSCYVCNIEYTNEDDHRNESSHILNLIQRKLDLVKGKQIYRMIDDTSVNCIICNNIIAVESKTSHLEDPEHAKNYRKCQDALLIIINSTEKVQSASITEAKPVKLEDSDNKPDDSNKQSDVVNGARDINQNVDIKKHKDDLEVSVDKCDESKPSQTEDADAEILSPQEAHKRARLYAKQNDLKYKRNGTYCRTCDVKISSSLKMMAEHVAEKTHQENKEKIKTKSQAIPKISMHDYINSGLRVRTRITDEVVINKEICVKTLNFFMITRNQFRASYMCQVCEMSVALDGIDAHIGTLKHELAMKTTPVLTDFKSEFIREVRPGIYHCGICNQIESTWDSLQNHMRSIDHAQKKRFAMSRLHEHLDDLRQEEESERIKTMLRLIHGFPI